VFNSNKALELFSTGDMRTFIERPPPVIDENKTVGGMNRRVAEDCWRVLRAGAGGRVQGALDLLIECRRADSQRHRYLSVALFRLDRTTR